MFDIDIIMFKMALNFLIKMHQTEYSVDNNQ
jgi:hypothetical protein